MFLATVVDPQSMGRFGRYRPLRHQILEDPERAQDMIGQFGDFKLPVFINASIRESEQGRVDAAIALIQTLAFEDTQDVHAIPDNVILLINVVVSLDRRVLNQRRRQLQPAGGRPFWLVWPRSLC